MVESGIISWVKGITHLWISIAKYIYKIWMENCDLQIVLDKKQDISYLVKYTSETEKY